MERGSGGTGNPEKRRKNPLTGTVALITVWREFPRGFHANRTGVGALPPGHDSNGPAYDHSDGWHSERRGSRPDLPATGGEPVPIEVGVSGRQDRGRRIARGLSAPGAFRRAGHRGRGGTRDLPNRTPVSKRLCSSAPVLPDYAVQWNADESRVRADRVGPSGGPLRLRFPGSRSRAH